MEGHREIVKRLRQEFCDHCFIAHYEFHAYSFRPVDQDMEAKWSLRVQAGPTWGTVWYGEHDSLAVLAARFREWVQTNDRREIEAAKGFPHREGCSCGDPDCEAFVATTR